MFEPQASELILVKEIRFSLAGPRKGSGQRDWDDADDVYMRDARTLVRVSRVARPFTERYTGTISQRSVR